MACILLDIDGVLHVSGDPIPGAVDAVAGLRRSGHDLRFVTNNSTRPRSRLAEELREMGFTLEDDELQTTPGAAASELAGKRVLALVMAAVVPDLEGLELVGHDAEAVLIGGCDETLEPNQVFSYMNLARAFEEIQMGASFYCLHKNKWWQTSRGPDARLRRVRLRARVFDRYRGDGARQAEPFVLCGRARRSRGRAGAAPGSLPTTSRRTFAALASSGCGLPSSEPGSSAPRRSSRRIRPRTSWCRLSPTSRPCSRRISPAGGRHEGFHQDDQPYRYAAPEATTRRPRSRLYLFGMGTPCVLASHPPASA